MQQTYEANIWKMYAIRLMFGMYFISAVLVPFYTEWGGIKFSQILFINAWFMFWNFLLEIPTGAVADFLGRKISIILGLITAAVGAVVYVSHPSFYVFLGAEVIFAVGYTLISGADEALIYDSLKEMGKEELSKKVFSRMASLMLAGIVIGAAAGGYIATWFGLRMTLLLQVIPYGIACVLAVTFKEPPVSEEETPARSFRAYRKILSDGITYFLKNKILKILTLDMVVVNAFSWIIIWFYQALLKEAGVAMKHFGFVHAFMSLAQIFIINNFIRMEKWFGSKKRVLFFGAFMTGVFYIILSVTTFMPLVVVGIILAAGFGLSRLPLFSSYMNKHIPSEKRATVLSTTSMLRTLSIVIINISAGLLSDWSIPRTLLILGIAVIIFTFISRIQEDHLID